MGQHKGDLKKLEHWVKKKYGFEDDPTLKNILGAKLKISWSGTKLSADCAGTDPRTGRKVLVDIIGPDEWRQILGKAVAYICEFKRAKVRDFEIWLVTDFSIPKFKGAYGCGRDDWREWYKTLNGVLHDVFGKALSKRVKIMEKKNGKLVKVS